MELQLILPSNFLVDSEMRPTVSQPAVKKEIFLEPLNLFPKTPYCTSMFIIPYAICTPSFM